MVTRFNVLLKDNCPATFALTIVRYGTGVVEHSCRPSRLLATARAKARQNDAVTNTI